jgi:hypothetical protein
MFLGNAAKISGEVCPIHALRYGIGISRRGLEKMSRLFAGMAYDRG